MPKLNKFLVASIIADIRECAYVSNEIYSWLGDIEHLSWKFPTKTAKDINAMEIVKEHDGTAGEFYILLLELAYDRIQYVLRLIVEFMDKYPFVEDFFKEVGCVSRSKQISLASLLRLIWDRLKTIPDSMSRRTVKNEKNEGRDLSTDKVSQGTQAGSSLNYCECCELAGKAVLRTINAIERVFAENKLISAAVTERNESRADIYERTQWSVMTKLTSGIERDVETALSMANEGELRTRAAVLEHEQTVRELRASLTLQEKRMDAVQAEKHELEELLENEKKELAHATRSNAGLERDTETLKETLEDTRRQMSMLCKYGKKNGAETSENAVQLAESKSEMEKTVIGLRKEVVDARDACLETERRYRALLDEARKANETLKEEQKEKVEHLEAEIAALRLLITTAKKENKRAKNVNDNGTVKGIQEEAIIKPEDDPVADMTQQLVSNREKIELLSRQNERLSKTLSRLREYRQTGQITTNDAAK